MTLAKLHLSKSHSKHTYKKEKNCTEKANFFCFFSVSKFRESENIFRCDSNKNDRGDEYECDSVVLQSVAVSMRYTKMLISQIKVMWLKRSTRAMSTNVTNSSQVNENEIIKRRFA